MTNIGFIGTGNMGTAIIKGILGSKLSSSINLFATDTDSEKLAMLETEGVTSCDNSNELVKKCKYIFLAVKPQVIENVLEDIASAVTEDTVIVSIAAGISGEFIQSKTITNGDHSNS